MARQPTRLILSFIGKTDLDFLQPKGDDLSPIRRLLKAVLDRDSELQRKRHIAAQNTVLVLFDDDPDGCNERAEFCDRLREQLPEVGLSGMELKRYPVSLKGPTDLSALYEQVWAAIPTSKPDCADEVVFHVTSGTPAMHLTLMLAAQSLRLDEARLFETSREQGVRELHPPYALALRRKRERERVAYRSPGSLSDAARKGLLKEIVVEDTMAASAYAALYKAASNRKQPQRVLMLICGPTGSGKWRACQQFAEWRTPGSVSNPEKHADKASQLAIWSNLAYCPELPEGATLLIRWLDAWPESALRMLAQLADERSDLAIAATLRTDRLPAGALATLACDGLRGAVSVDLPALSVRSDVVALAESLARQLGILDGKLKERLQYDLLTDVFPRNLHDLKGLLATANARSPSAHPERKAYLQARELRDTRRLLDEAWQVAAGMDFGPEGHRLDDVLNAIRTAVVRRARTEGRSQKQVGELLGLSQSTVSDFLKIELDPRLWPSLRDADHAD
ncbi:hypothetical protein ThidrDRAFT_1146 [Thiorhodococcus drewsii AZ1]|uniref:Uncharacterized protein n=1 Tax=Thiorhodococcus drewsii AZ1 TaxID=765913 RepID=G2DYN4_9GAMM|nr:hypothetical protein [Thiorhodococcus drewsii]EGV32661.1 hypothetical protein ThidrDRAFT_1146 [Thiorhodococcus drewsii AZ1]